MFGTIGATISGNSDTGQGGGLCLFTTGIVRNSTITNNQSADEGGGLYAPGGTFDIGSTIISGNSAPERPEISVDSGTPASSGFNLIGNSTGDAQDIGVAISYQASDILNTAPVLGPLADNGGPTFTHRPAYFFPGHDKGCAFGATLDQRGMPRTIDFPIVANATCGNPSENGTDIGAFELPTPTAGGAFVSGRVTDSSGKTVVIGAQVMVTDVGGKRVGSTTTNSFGVFTVSDVPVGGIYVVSVSSKGYTFDPSSQVVQVDGDTVDVNFVGSSPTRRRRGR